MFCQNLGPVDRALRAIVGLVLISLIFVGPQTLWGLVGLVPLLTAVIGSCPAYTLLGIRTCRTDGRTV
ncbi:YgaP family membrane protein [Azospirillum thermophilum]|uniref:DUF2892 domain-containing protein n=1 Tax=Azospirillum thermophilum TaxID=2202148 RepID=A0A2S2CP94_9PROT|nr:DUF2892 domain-containing protein [Azospirillum thermophilum]AWK86321.1 DUF2892 domain-containing protein [Azospirillum thermophilum]